MSSSDVDAARNPMAEPTRPIPIIDKISIHSLDYKYRYLRFMDDGICNTSKKQLSYRAMATMSLQMTATVGAKFHC
jgi:hypothetical protein